MHNVVSNLNLIKSEIKSDNKTEIIVVSKTFPMNNILPLVNSGHKHYGESKVQEAIEKWTDIKRDYSDIKLHLVGKLQTNKVKYVIPLFDYLHSLDNLKLAIKISNEQKKKNFKPKIFIQVNIGNEVQKSGIEKENLFSFYNTCINDLDLDIIGLMCLPPFEKDSNPYFAEIKSLAEKLQLKELSMGMSEDYLEAIKYGTTFLRIGSKIFGPRN
jgi:hypothetical protein